MTKYTPMMEQYLALKETVPDALLFFRLGDFYELFFDDALTASRALEITLTGREAGQPERVPMCGVPHHSSEGYIARLIEQGFKVAIAEQMENPGDSKGVVKRDIVRLITPGTVLESRSLTDTRNNFIAAMVQTADGHFGLAVSDWSTGELHVSDAANWNAAIDTLLVYQVRELLAEEQLLETMNQYVHTTQQTWVSSIWSEEQTWTEGPIATALASELVMDAVRKASERIHAYFWYTQKQAPVHIQRIIWNKNAERLRIDPLTRRSLELSETIREKSKQGSLLWLLDETKTAMGARLLRQWLEQPLRDIGMIVARQDAVHQLTDAWLLRESMRDALREVYDLERLLARVSVGTAHARDLLALQKSLASVPALADTVLAVGSKTLSEMTRTLDRCLEVEADIARVIVEEPPISLKEGGLIRDGVDEQLDKWREASRNGKQWMADLERQERDATGIRSLKVGYNKVFGYYIEVTKANVGSVPIDRYERKQTLSTGERYVTPELKVQEALILEAEERLSGREFELFTELRARVAAHLPHLQRLAHWIAQMDAFQSMATVAVQQRWVKPDLHDGFDLQIEGGRHPVVEAVLKDQSFIANDAELTQSAHAMMLITGPNMAGKSTYMRQVALICILAQMGSFVPATSAKLPLLDRIFTRIGAADDLVAGQSTFMTEMMDIRLMTEQATKQSLVIIDELGRGTSTDEGMAIAQAVIEFLHHHIGCKTLVSTHFHELAILEQSLNGLANFAMAVREQADRVTFLRKLIRGAATLSYGVYCAKLAGLPNEVIDRASALLEHPEWRLSRAIESTSENPSPRPVSVQPQVIVETKTVLKDHPILTSLRELNVMNMTPIQALAWLDQMKQSIESEK